MFLWKNCGKMMVSRAFFSSTLSLQIFFFLDWPVFNEVDNLVHRDYDQLDNQRVSVFPTENKIVIPRCVFKGLAEGCVQ